MKYGARNQLKGKVTEIKTGDIMCQVTLNVSADSIMNSVMTMDSLNDLGIREGDEVQVIVKAINVLVVKEK